MYHKQETWNILTCSQYTVAKASMYNELNMDYLVITSASNINVYQKKNSQILI